MQPGRPAVAPRPASPARADTLQSPDCRQRPESQDGGHWLPFGRADRAVPRAIGAFDMAETDMLNLTMMEAASHIERRALSPVELTEAVLQRIAAVDKMLSAYITVCADQAREVAQATEKM